MQSNYNYLLRLQFLGFRYHGWQKQPGVKTVQLRVEKTLRFVLGGGVRIKTLGASRTDAMVSAEDFPCQLYLQEALPADFLALFNANLPSDIQVISLEPVTPAFNVIQDVVEKEYHYSLLFGSEKQPFDAHLSAYVPFSLDAPRMSAASYILQGRHNFNAFTYPYEAGGVKLRTIDRVACSYETVKIRLTFISKGFMRYQIRLMVGALVEIGRGEKSENDLIASLTTGHNRIGYFKAPASGLLLKRVQY